MRTVTTLHTLPAGRAHFHEIDDYLHPDALLNLLQARVEDKSRAPCASGKKRALLDPEEPSRKRVKTDLAVDVSAGTDASNQEFVLPAYSHTLILEYTGVTPSSGYWDAQRYEHEKELKDWLSNHQSSSIGLGEVYIKVHYGKLLVFEDERAARCYYPQFMRLPMLESIDDMDNYDFRLRSLSDPLFAICSVACSPKDSGRYRLETNLKLEVLPFQEADADKLPFRLHLEVVVSLLFPGFCLPQPFPRESEDETRRIVDLVFRRDEALPEHWQFNGKADIPLLFSILGPAPRLPYDDVALQPPTLRPTLLPFQRRSVAWLLSREGKQLTPSGELVPLERSDDSHPPLFWTVVTTDNGCKIYVNHILGRISLTRPEEENAPLGGILAEEPGLGKTLECIALILLNPAISRNPSTTSWDPIAKVDVREVPTTLIVTPPQLAPQWMDEIKKHAPTLKVFVYDGWSKIKVPVSAAEIAAEREKRAQVKKKAEARAARAAGAARGEKIKTFAEVEEKQAGVDTQMRSTNGPDEDVIDWCTYVSGFDVVITTYTVLQQDLGVARPPPERPRRSNVRYENIERARSPLIMCEWYRVIMDEVQMVGGGKTEEMVSLIPRVSSFAVSGTPARAQVSDLIHVLKFLRVSDVIDAPRVWTRLFKPGYVREFAELFNRYTIRTMKDTVKNELTIPRQTRYLVPIELGRVERHVYDQQFEKALLDLGLDARGVAVSEDWQADTTMLRTWLRKLRGICTHPQVGQLSAHNEKLHKPGVLKSMGEVLEDMREKNWRSYMEDRRNKVQAQTHLVQLKQHDEADINRYRNALDVLLLAEKEALALIADIELAIEEHAARGRLLKEATSSGQDPLKDNSGKGKAREQTPSESVADTEDTDFPKTAAGEEHANKRRALQQRLRECQITLHKVYFLKGDVYHVIGATYSDAENEAYESAEALRRLLLKSTERAATRAITQLGRDVSKKGLREEDLYIDVPYFNQSGVKSRDLVEGANQETIVESEDDDEGGTAEDRAKRKKQKLKKAEENEQARQRLMEEANEMIDELLNEQSALLLRWRTRLIGLLTQSVTSQGDEADGQEYSRSLETQGEAETYLQVYAALLADRRQALTSERTLLAAHDVQEKKSRRTKAARRAEDAAMEDDVLMLVGDLDPQPEHEVLLKQLNDERKALLQDFNTGRALRSIMVDLNNLAASIRKKDDPTKIVSSETAGRLRQLLVQQAKLMGTLQADLALFRKAFNDRIAYFRQLQELSDTVAEAEWQGSLADAINRVQAERMELEMKIVTGRARQRYLDNLARTQEEGADAEEDECCILCKCEFTRGYITGCGHIFCETCMKAWLERKERSGCPVCRVRIQSDQLQRFVVADSKVQAQVAAPARIVNNEIVPKSRREIKYNLIDPDLFESIQMMESYGSYGSKIQTLVRHLLYVQISDPGSKTIVFSAWADSLHIIEHALKSNGISCLRVDRNTAKQNAAKKFRDDPEIQVLLLHGERENAGLNITCASRVILVESVVNHAFELQAIARIDRMGQTRPTEVYCYYAEDTVERNILDLAARQGLSLYTQENSAGTLNVAPLKAALRPTDKDEVDAPTKKVQKGDFIFKTDDMLAIFFPHLFEDIEYLLPTEEIEGQTSAVSNSGTRAGQFVNAVAGPSRLN